MTAYNQQQVGAFMGALYGRSPLNWLSIDEKAPTCL